MDKSTTNPYIYNQDSQLFICEWLNCEKTTYSDLTIFLGHLKQHGHGNRVHVSEENRIICEWADCADEFDYSKIKEFQLHLSYHGYHSKLMSYGSIEIKKISKPNGQTSTLLH